MMKRIYLAGAACLCMLAALPLCAAQATKTAPAPAAVVKTVPPEQLTEIEKLRLENLQMKFALLQVQEQQAAAPLAKQLQDFTAEIEAAHPGKTLDQKNGTLVAVGATPPAPTPPPATK